MTISTQYHETGSDYMYTQCINIYSYINFELYISQASNSTILKKKTENCQHFDDFLCGPEVTDGHINNRICL